MCNDFFPQNIKFLLDKGEINVKTILELTGNNSPSLITMWKTRERQITTKDLIVLANHLGYTIDELINKDLSKINKSDNLQILYDKSKDILSDDDKATIEFIMQKAIDNYKKKNEE